MSLKVLELLELCLTNHNETDYETLVKRVLVYERSGFSISYEGFKTVKLIFLQNSWEKK